MLFQWNVDQLMSQIAISLYNLKKLWNHVILSSSRNLDSPSFVAGPGKVGKVKGNSLTAIRNVLCSIYFVQLRIAPQNPKTPSV